MPVIGEGMTLTDLPRASMTVTPGPSFQFLAGAGGSGVRNSSCETLSGLQLASVLSGIVSTPPPAAWICLHAASNAFCASAAEVTEPNWSRLYATPPEFGLGPAGGATSSAKAI